MKQILLIVTLALLVACGGKEGKQGEAGETGATGPAGQDATEWFISIASAKYAPPMTDPKRATDDVFKRPVKLTVNDKVFEYKTGEECVRLKSAQVKALVVSLPEVPGSPPPVAKSTQPAVTVCDNTNASKEDDCNLYPFTIGLFKDKNDKGGPAPTASGGQSTPVTNLPEDWQLNFHPFVGGLTSVQQAECKTI